MREIKVPLESFYWPYVIYRARDPERRELSPAQRRAVAMMREGVWYERECGDPLPSTLNALVRLGWCRGAEMGRRGADGKLALWTNAEWLVYVLFSKEPKIDQPMILYRLVDGARGERGVP